MNVSFAFQQFDDLLGLARLELFHINDSAKPLGSRADRHAGIGLGEIAKLRLTILKACAGFSLRAGILSRFCYAVVIATYFFYLVPAMKDERICAVRWVVGSTIRRWDQSDVATIIAAAMLGASRREIKMLGGIAL